jgi:hypothetical protein
VAAAAAAASPPLWGSPCPHSQVAPRGVATEGFYGTQDGGDQLDGEAFFAVSHPSGAPK